MKKILLGALAILGLSGVAHSDILGPTGRFLQIRSDLQPSSTVHFSSGSVATSFYLEYGTPGRCVELDSVGKMVTAGGPCGTGGGGGQGSLEVFNNFDATRTSPTASISLDSTFLGAVNGSTYTFKLNSSSVTLQGAALGSSNISITNAAGSHTIGITGRIPASNMVSTVAYTNEPNIFTASQTINAPLFVTSTFTVTSSTIIINGSTTYWDITRPGSDRVFQIDSAGRVTLVPMASGGGGGGSPLEVFSNFDATKSSPTASVSVGDALKLSVSGSTAIITVDQSSVTLKGQNGVILNQNTLQSGATAYPAFVHVGSSMSIYGDVITYRPTNSNMADYVVNSAASDSNYMFFNYLFKDSGANDYYYANYSVTSASVASPSGSVGWGQMNWGLLSQGTNADRLSLSGLAAGTGTKAYLALQDDMEIRMYDTSGLGGNYVSMASSPTIANSFRTYLPSIPGTAGQVRTIASVVGSDIYETYSTPSGGGGGTTIWVQDGGSNIVQTSTMNFNGNQFIITDDSGKGLVTLNSSSVTLYGASIPSASIAAGSLGGGVIASSFTPSGVTAGTYGSANRVSSITVNAQGLITGAANVLISISTSNLNATGTASGTTFLRGDNTWASPSGTGDVILASSQTHSGWKNFDSPAGSTFTYGVVAGSFTSTGSGVGKLTLKDSDGSHYVSIESSGSITHNSAYVLPLTTGTPGQILAISAINGDGKFPLYWATDGGSGGGGYALQPATVTPNFAVGALASTMTVTSTFTVTGGTISVNGIPYRFPNARGSASQFLQTDGAAAGVQSLIWATPAGAGDVVAVGSNTLSGFNTLLGSTTFSGATSSVTFANKATNFTGVSSMTFNSGSALALLSGSTLAVNGSMQASGSYGSSGQFLQSAGAGLPPVWATASGSGDAVLAATQTFSGRNTFSNTTTHSKGINASTITTTGNVVLNGDIYVQGPNQNIIIGQSNNASIGYSGSKYELYSSTNFAVSGGSGGPGAIRLYNNANNGYVAFKASASIFSSIDWTLPNADGTSGQAIVTNGAGNLSFATVGGSGGGSFVLGVTSGTSDAGYSSVIASPTTTVMLSSHTFGVKLTGNSTAYITQNFNWPIRPEIARSTSTTEACAIQNAATDFTSMLLCDASANEDASFTSILYPYNGGRLYADVFFSMASATSGNVVNSVQIYCSTRGATTAIDSVTWPAANNATIAVPGTAGYPQVGTITASTVGGSCVQGAMVMMRFSRNGGNSSDTATGDQEVRFLRLYEN